MQIEIHLNYEPDRASSLLPPPSSFLCLLTAEIRLNMPTTDIATVGAFNKWWTLEGARLRPFWTEANFIGVSYFQRGANVVEVSTAFYSENVVV
jgi:hypothetical protein